MSTGSHLRRVLSRHERLWPVSDSSRVPLRSTVRFYFSPFVDDDKIRAAAFRSVPWQRKIQAFSSFDVHAILSKIIFSLVAGNRWLHRKFQNVSRKAHDIFVRNLYSKRFDISAIAPPLFNGYLPKYLSHSLDLYERVRVLCPSFDVNVRTMCAE